MCRDEKLLATLLSWGTWGATGMMAVGLAIDLIMGLIKFRLGPQARAFATEITTAGIVLLILLPVVRVAVMLCLFLKARDYQHSALAAFVALMILLGLLLGSA